MAWKSWFRAVQRTVNLNKRAVSQGVLRGLPLKSGSVLPIRVEEKLQGTLELRIGESFRQVSDRLERVHQSLGEMQTLAVSVGDLKKIFSNVKTRGTWGEMQLGQLLANTLAPHQYDMNVAVRPGSADRVEFAVRMPSHVDEVNYMPIDSKFPIAAWQRLVEAIERGDADAAASADAQLELEVRRCATDIASKYIESPYTTDHAILFVPTEALYAEIARRSTLMEELVGKHPIVVAGPLTLSSILSTVNMAFRTVTLHKRTEDIGVLLGVVKTEMGTFESLLKKLRKKLQAATNHIDTMDARRRLLGKALRDVEGATGGEALGLDIVGDDVDAAA